ncbi:hypothetical protein TNCV_2065871 [Trichonephila clavipes]|nr:hypothetical protein TNCV_2065871 [Trichonephila clavipes]
MFVSARENTLRTTSTAQRTPTSNCRREGEEENEKNTYITPELPKVNFWEQRAKTAAQRQQSTSTNQQKPPTTTTSPSKQSNNPETISDIFEELKNPAVQETFELLEEFIKIATTIPTRFGRLRAIHQLCKNEINI